MKNIYYISVWVSLGVLTGCHSRAETHFIDRCAAGGHDASACECIYEKISDHYPSNWMDHLGENGWLPNDVNTVLRNAAQECHVN